MSSSLSPVSDGQAPSLLWGPFFGMLLSAVLVGTVGAQAWTYFHRNSDSVLLRATVVVLFNFVLVSNCLDIATTFNYTISHFEDPAAIDQLPRYFIVELVVSGIPVFIVDVFFASRIHHLNRGYSCLSYIIVITALTAFACGCVPAGFLFNVPTRINLSSTWVKSPFCAQNVLRAFTALISSGAICWAYRGNLAKTKRTKSVLQSIIQFTVTRGILLSVVQIMVAVMFEVAPQTLRWVIFHMMLDKIYVITMLTMLNSRANFRETLSVPITDSDFLRRSLSASKKMKNITIIARNSMQLQANDPNDQVPSQVDYQQGNLVKAESDSDIDLQSLRSGQLAGILVSHEKITAIDYGNARHSPV
ncbi:hypothetical protein GYMLUDRAFT_101347 [Collybiopsis luxurians FD-317 M1]|uniref:DUF6534 domain-containing protein n=1 Tax=Collybiopsis luxurians FD-317 M1 TaxID=944289 RepID=A0A0D0C5X7_9AGAR|nr:hypothetical protein GYMLUDRAFT_101347 [Collybiopsis luxurians FD-317 M1]